MQGKERSANVAFQSKFGLGSDSTVDADNIAFEDPVQIWQPLWSKYQGDDFCQKINIYCPKCLRTVRQEEQAVFTENWRDRKFIAHEDCHMEDTFVTEFTRKAQMTKEVKANAWVPLKVGSRQFYVSVTLNHVLNSHKFYSGSTKLLLDAQKKLVYQPHLEDCALFEPRSIIIPMKQFSVVVEVQEICAPVSTKKTLKFTVDLNRFKGLTANISFTDNQITFEAQLSILTTAEQKKVQVQSSNCKFPFSFQNIDIVKMGKYTIWVNTEQNINEVASICQSQQFDQNSPCSLSYLKESQNFYFCPSPTQISSPLYEPMERYGNCILEIEDLEEENKNFISWIKTHAGSKQFQRKSSSMSLEEIELTVSRILPYIEDIVRNDYANYMLQSLLTVSTFSQRILIIQQMKESFCQLACEQQGTFVYQQMIGNLESEQQFQLICEIVAPFLGKLVMDNYGNHFMRKLLQFLPPNFLYYFKEQIAQHLIDFSINKNGVCVVKSYLKALKQGQKLIPQLSLESSRIIKIITINTSVLINDQFGNYIIQEAFQIFSCDNLQGVTEYILRNCSKCSCEKYSSNVIQYCLRKYWRLNQTIFKSLKNSLENKNIIYMYHNKDGNKVLLQILGLPYPLGIKDKIKALVMSEQTSKFNPKKWMEIVGKGKTGYVGTSYNNFSDAHQPPKKKPQHYKN